MVFSLLAAGALLDQTALASPFLTQLNATTWVIGNDLWNMTQDEKYGTKLWYKGKDLVGDAVGHYTSYNGARNDLAWTSAKIALETEDYIDVQFDAVEGEMHWVIWNDLPGAYQYFINRALPNLGEFRTLWRLDNETFPRGRTDGRPAAGAAGAGSYYTTYADEEGRFAFPHVLTGTYALQAWANGGEIGDVLGRFVEDDIDLSAACEGKDLGELTWQLPEGRNRIFQVGASDRRSLGFKYGGAPYEHGLVAKCPANLTFTVGQSNTEEWCFGQSALGTWSIGFDLSGEELTAAGNRSALLSVSLAGYSQGTSSGIYVNGQGATGRVGNLTTGSIPSDQCLYRSATQAGEWHFFEFPVARALLREGRNTVSFVVERTTLWRGFLWDSIVLEWL
ncbi:hypothetical protein KVT40_003489 [Elsinoe batatas]|uniref:Rhamnogalacturonan endolyase n=1 Tax=Elsinoe batatas TaxID=2601811 RepID=A0A8K0PL77_9PEZI|nr:hypothetical protein KVT40_003489 [Elsinoe batatas]